MEEIKNELKSIALEMVQSNSNQIDDWLDKTSQLYEKLLVLKYLDDRDVKLNSIRESVQTQLEQIVNEPILPVVPESATEIEAAEAPKVNIQSEIRVVPHPEGPPTFRSIPVEKKEDDSPSETTASTKQPEKQQKQSIAEKAASNQKKSLNERLSNQTIKFGLNDRIAFVKHLFNGESEDFQRVVSQLNTFDSKSEADHFIHHIVKPEYGWNGKEEFEERFLTIINLRFE